MLFSTGTVAGLFQFSYTHSNEKLRDREQPVVDVNKLQAYLSIFTRAIRNLVARSVSEEGGTF